MNKQWHNHERPAVRLYMTALTYNQHKQPFTYPALLLATLLAALSPLPPHQVEGARRMPTIAPLPTLKGERARQAQGQSLSWAHQLTAARSANVSQGLSLHDWRAAAASGAAASQPIAPIVEPDIVYYHHDATGNLAAVTDEGGQVVWRAEVRPFGQGAALPPDRPLRFVGQPREEEIGEAGGLYHMGARFYDPLTGRFMSTEPLMMAKIKRENPQRFNKYSYALGNPLRYQDASGLEAVIIITRDAGIGSHAAIWLDNNGHAVLYDPGGNYNPVNDLGEPMRGTNDILYDAAADLNAFITYHKSTGSEVEIYRFQLTSQEEEEIVRKIEEIGGEYGPFFCAIGVCEALRGIGPFIELGTHPLPGSLADVLKELEAGNWTGAGRPKPPNLPFRQPYPMVPGVRFPESPN